LSNNSHLVFCVPGKPQAKQRARVCKFGTYTPKETINYENLITMCFLDQIKIDNPIESPIIIYITARFAPANSFSATKKRKMIVGNIKHTQKPDLDNIIKTVKDALNKVAYKDDSQIYAIWAKKEYHDKDELLVTIKEVCE